MRTQVVLVEHADEVVARALDVDDQHEIRAVELDGHPFFLGTAFQRQQEEYRADDHRQTRLFHQQTVDGRGIDIALPFRR